MMKIKLLCLLFLTFHCAAFAQDVTKEPRLKAVYENGRWGYADRSGRMIVAAQFDAARPFVDGLAQVGVVDEELPEVLGRPNLKWGYIDERGRVLVQLRYAVLRSFSENLAAAALLNAEKPERPSYARASERRNLTWGYVDRSGREVIPFQFLNAGDFAEGLAQVNVGQVSKSRCNTPGNYGYIDRTGAFIIKPQFTTAASFQKGRARVSIGQIRYLGRCVCCAPRFFGKYGYIDRSGTFIADKAQPDDSKLEGWEN